MFLLAFPLVGQETQDSLIAEGDDKSKHTIKTLFSGTPGKAFLYSLVLPGAGQAYNKRYWKIPIVYAALGTTGYLLWDNLNTFNQYDDAYKLRVDMGDSADDIFPQLSREQVRSNRELVRKRVQQSYIGLGLIYFLGAAEAFVDNHLLSFDMSDDLSGHLQLRSSNEGIGLVCQFKPKQPLYHPAFSH
jgi:hypothetical protein